jgi:hypothetical protein
VQHCALATLSSNPSKVNCNSKRCFRLSATMNAVPDRPHTFRKALISALKSLSLLHAFLQNLANTLHLHLGLLFRNRSNGATYQNMCTRDIVCRWLLIYMYGCIYMYTRTHARTHTHTCMYTCTYIVSTGVSTRVSTSGCFV